MKTHTCIAVYDSSTRTEHAVKELLSAGIEESKLSVIGRRPTPQPEHDTEAKENIQMGLVAAIAIGGLYADDFTDNSSASGMDGLIVAGPLFAMMEGMNGADTDSVMEELGIDADSRQYYNRVIAEGGSLVAIETDAPNQQQLIETIFQRTKAEKFTYYEPNA